ncbi:MAG: M23 family metallopeptidase [Candidatus Tectomicrobia bacterium]|nr:M23 family metallopeptidase [Candidatus Tectomicrobia bacterium]
MASKKYTIMVIPTHASGARRFVISRRAVAVTVLLVLSLIGASAYLFVDRITLERGVSRLEPLMERVQAQRAVLDRMGERLREMDQSLVRLRKLEEQLRIMASLKPSERRTDLGVGGVSRPDLLDTADKLPESERLVVGRLGRQFLDMERRATEQEGSFKEIVATFGEKRVLLAHTPSILPAKGWVTSAFGQRRSVFTGGGEFHAGLDIVARVGTPILAPSDGVVITSGRESGYGNIIEIRHMQGIITRYAHNHRHLVRVGQKVRRGDVIGEVGNTGRTTGPHLHYEVRLNGVAVNPMLYIVEEVAFRK